MPESSPSPTRQSQPLPTIGRTPACSPARRIAILTATTSAGVLLGISLMLACIHLGNPDIDRVTAVVAILLLAISTAARYITRAINSKIHSLWMPSSDAYSEGWEAGYDRGWRECEKQYTPRRVVPLRAVPTGTED